MKYLVVLGRILYSLLFIMAIMVHFSSEGINYAASKGIPVPAILVPVSGVIAFVGGLCIAAGFKAKWGALLLIVFLLPVTFTMHDFWNVQDEMQSQIQMSMFMKNMSLLGAALMISYFGSGPLSLDTLMRNKKQNNIL